MGDVIFWFILGLDRGKPESIIYDESAAPELEASLRSFRGMRILSEDPLIIESFSDSWTLDAEFMYGEYFPVDINLGSAPWHTIALGIRAEIDKEMTFSSDKASQLQVDQMGFHTGPAIEVLARHLTQASAEAYIPYANVLSQYIDGDEVAERYGNLSTWYNDKRHFWIGTGPMYLERVYPVEKMIVLKRNPYHPDPADKWTMFEEPRIPEIEVISDGRLQVRRNSEFAFDVKITFDGEAYLNEHLTEVKYMVRDSRGNVAVTGVARPVADGHYRVEMLPADTRQLPIGSNTLDVIVLSQLVGGASFGTVTFVTTP